MSRDESMTDLRLGAVDVISSRSTTRSNRRPVPPSDGSAAGVEQNRVGIGGRAVAGVNLEVEVRARAGGVPARADGPDHLAGCDIA
jgi:hypothetical protein